MKLALAAAISILTLGACAPVGNGLPEPIGSVVTVEVNATYRERIALTPGHVLTVKIEDVSLADASAVVLNEVTVPLDGRAPPYRVRMEVPSSSIKQNHRYSARAEIRDSEGKLRFTTDTHHGVLTMGQAAGATIVMIGVS